VHGHVSNKLFTIVFHSFEVIRTSTDRKSLLIKLNVVAVIFTFPCRRYSTAHFMSCWQTFHVYISTTFNRVPREQEFRGVQLLAQLERQQTAPNLRSNPKNTCKHLDIPLLIMKAVGKPLSRLLVWPSISHRMHAILRLSKPERPYTKCLPVLSKRRASSVDVLATIQYLARNSQAVNSFPIQDDGKFCKHQVCWRS
jgi:hypothetical protein